MGMVLGRSNYFNYFNDFDDSAISFDRVRAVGRPRRVHDGKSKPVAGGRQTETSGPMAYWSPLWLTVTSRPATDMTILDDLTKPVKRKSWDGQQAR
jgi:hypothetical protein